MSTKKVVLQAEKAPLPKKVAIKDLIAIAEQSSAVLHAVRDKMLEPMPRKTAPSFKTADVINMCGLTKNRFDYLLRNNPLLPQGTIPEQKRTRYFSLQESQELLEKIGIWYKRPKDIPGLTIAVGNFKGGVSKTSTVMTLAQALNLRGRKVLIVDLDPQASLTTLNGTLPDTEITAQQTILPLIYKEKEDLRYAPMNTYWDGIDLIPGFTMLFNAELVLMAASADKTKPTEFWDVLRKGLEPLKYEYDVILIDTPPALSLTTLNAFQAADGLIVPIPPAALDFASSVSFWTLFSEFYGGIAKNLLERFNYEFEKEYDFVSILKAKVRRNEGLTDSILTWMNLAYGEHVLPDEIPMTRVTENASASFSTVYDISEYEGNQKTYTRAREAYDKVGETIDNMLVTIWRHKAELSS